MDPALRAEIAAWAEECVQAMIDHYNGIERHGPTVIDVECEVVVDEVKALPERIGETPGRASEGLPGVTARGEEWRAVEDVNPEL